MRIFFLFSVFILIFVGGCNTVQTHNSTAKKENNEPNTRKISQEEQKYIQLVLNKDYDTLEAQTQKQSNKVQKDYNNIAFALKNFQEAQKLVPDENGGTTNQDIQMKYFAIEKALKDVKYIPNEIKKQITEVENNSIKMDKYYSKFVDKQVEQRKTEIDQENIEENQDKINQEIKDRTEDPQQVKIGMTKEEVLTKGWGTPIDENKTTTSNGTSEQWVYSGYKYLYFENGVLTEIQD